MTYGVETDQIYESVLEDFKKMGSGRIRRQVKNVLGLIDLSSNEKIIEIGVATGKFTSIMSKQNHVFALDLLFENLERTQKAVSELGNVNNLFCVNADGSFIPFLDSSFDKVVAVDIIEHLTDEIFSKLLKEVKRIIKKEGSFYIYTPNLLHPYELSRPLRPIMRQEHIGVRTRAKICDILKMENFKIKKSNFSNCFRRISIEAVKNL